MELTYLRYKNQALDGSCANEEAQTEEGSIQIEILLERVEGDDDCSRNDACYVHSESNTLGVIEALDLDLAY
jgi:hypothetical protein